MQQIRKTMSTLPVQNRTQLVSYAVEDRILSLEDL
jgi:hypothetical protein